MNGNSKVPRIYKKYTVQICMVLHQIHDISLNMINPEHLVDVKDCGSVQLKNMHVIDLVMFRPNINFQFKAHNIY